MKLFFYDVATQRNKGLVKATLVLRPPICRTVLVLKKNSYHCVHFKLHNMTENNRIEIHLSKAKLLKLLLFSVLFLIAGIWMVTADPQTSNPLFNNPFVKGLASYGATIMGALGIYFFTKKLFQAEPGFVLSEEGIYDNTSAFKFGLIPWSDISSIYEGSVQASIASKQYFVTVGLEDPEKYIAREPNSIKRKLLLANAKGYGSPVHISTNGLKVDHKELLELVQEYFEKYKVTQRGF
jgi:hypothetical protein